MKIQPLSIPGAYLIHLDLKHDDRGFFTEVWRDSSPLFVQFNHSWSVNRTLRGLHYQTGMGKYVHVVSGEILDVVFDLETGKYLGVQLDKSNALYVPPGLAHGFLALTDANVVYACTREYDPKEEGGIHWTSIPEEAHFWPFQPEIISEKDRSLPVWKPQWE